MSIFKNLVGRIMIFFLNNYRTRVSIDRGQYLFYVFYSTKCDIEIYNQATLSGLGDIIGSLNNDGRKTTMVE